MSALGDLAAKAKKLPWPTIAIVGGGAVVLFLVLRSGGGGGSTVATQGGMDGAQLQLALAGMGYADKGDERHATLQALQMQGAQQLALATLGAQTDIALTTYQTDAQYDIAKMNYEMQAAAEASKLAFYDRADERQYLLAKGVTDAQVNMAANANNAMIAISNLQSTVQIAQLNTAATTQLGLAAYSAEIETARSRDWANVNIVSAQEQTKQAKIAGKTQTMGGLFGLVGSLFG